MSGSSENMDMYNGSPSSRILISDHKDPNFLKTPRFNSLSFFHMASKGLKQSVWYGIHFETLLEDCLKFRDLRLGCRL